MIQALHLFYTALSRSPSSVLHRFALQSRAWLSLSTEGNSDQLHCAALAIGSNDVMTAADGMCMSYGLPTTPVPLVPIPTPSLYLGRVGGCPVVGGSLTVPSPTCSPPPAPSLPEGEGGGGGWLADSVGLCFYYYYPLSAMALDKIRLKGRVRCVQNSLSFLGRFPRCLPSLGVNPCLCVYSASRSSISYINNRGRSAFTGTPAWAQGFIVPSW